MIMAFLVIYGVKNNRHKKLSIFKSKTMPQQNTLIVLPHILCNLIAF
jgi:hypothetical protein